MITINRKNPTPGEVTSSLSNAENGGLHFDGAAGRIDIASPPDLGTKFSFEFVLKADSFGSSNLYFLDFGNGGRFIFGTHSSISYNWGIFDNTSWKSFGVKLCDDLKVHHLVVTIDSTSATLFDNGVSVGTATISASHGIDSCSDAFIGSAYSSAVNLFEGTLSRTRFYNRVLSSSEIKEKFENKNLKFSEIYGSQTNLVTNGTFTGGTTGWGLTSVTYGTNNVVWAAAGGWAYIRRADWNITVGKKYRITYDISGHSANGVLQLWDYGGANTIATLPEITGNGTFTHEFEALKSSSSGVILGKVGSTFVGTMDNVSCVAIGAVSDYDLAFANPTQSLMVQDRAGAADGTASATGVLQTQKIVQLNSKAISVSAATARTPADGEIVADEFSIAEFKTSTNVLETNVAGQTGARLRAAVSDVGTPTFSFNDDTDTGMYRAAANELGFTTAGVARMTISSAGLVTVTNATESKLRLTNTKDWGSSDSGNIGTLEFYTTDASGAGARVLGAVQCAQNAGSGAPNGELVFKTALGGGSAAAAVERMRISSEGRVSIGGSADPYSLSADTTNTLTIQATGTNKAGALDIAATGTGWVGVNLGNETIRRGFIGALNGSDMAFYTNPTNAGTAVTERLRVSSAGVVSITKNADGALGAELRLVNDPGSSTTAGTEARLTFAPHHSGTEVASIRAIAENTGAKTKLSFYTHSGSALAERMVIDGAGEIVVNDSTGTEAGRITTIGNNLTISGTVVNHCGFSFATNAILPATQSATNNNTVDLGQNGNSFKDFYLAGEAKLAGITTLGSSSELTIASGGITITSSYHTVDTEGDAASDNLNTINGGSTGSILILNSVTSRSVTLKDDSDNLRLAGDFTLSQANDSIMLIKFGTTWREISRSTNG